MKSLNGSALRRTWGYCIAALAAGGLQAQTIVVSNVDDPAPVDFSTYTVNNALKVATSFTTGAAQTKLFGVQLALDGGIGNLGVSIYSNSGGAPGTLLTTLSHGSGMPATEFRDPLPIQMSGNTTYWVVLELSGGGVVRPKIASSGGETGLAGWSIGDAVRSNPGLGWEATVRTPFQMTVMTKVDDLTPVPEPEEWAAIMGLSLAGFAIWRRRSSARA